MHAIVSLMDERHYTLMEDYWHKLETACGLAGVSQTPLPHFSWHIAAEYDFPRLEETLSEFSKELEPFIVRTAGLGLFTGDLPVIFVPLIKDLKLAGVHERLWVRSQPTAIGASSHYSPEVWMPHITLAHGDVSRDKLGCAMQDLAFQPFNWEVRVDHFALVYQFSGQTGKIQSKFPFSG